MVIQNSQTQANQAPVRCLANRAIGVDVHSQILVCYAEVYDPDTGQLSGEGGQFNTKQSGLKEFAQWCRKIAPETILMESTSVYWLPVYACLEEVGFTNKELVVVKANDVRAAKGRKSDFMDSRRLAEYARLGNYKASFIPESDIREARTFGRAYKAAVKLLSSCKNRLHKTYASIGMNLNAVFSDTRGKAAEKIIEAFFSSDDHDHFEAVVHRNCSRLKASAEEIIDAFAKVDSPLMREHVKMQRQWIQKAETQRDEAFSLLKRKLAFAQPYIKRLMTVPGISEVSAYLIVSEIGTDLSAFRSVARFCSWVGISSGNNQSAGKNRSGRAPKGNKYLKSYLIEAAQALARASKNGGALYKRFLAFNERMNRNKAVFALAHKLARIIYAMLKQGTDYQEKPDQNLQTILATKIARSLARGRKEGLLVVNDLVVNANTGAVFNEKRARSG